MGIRGNLSAGCIGAGSTLAVLLLTTAGPVEVSDGVASVIAKYPAGPDINSYLTAGQTIANSGFRVDSLDWFFELWPPALPTLHAMVIRLALGDHLVLVESVLLSLLIGTLVSILWSTSSWRYPLRIALVSCVPIAIYIGIGLDRYRLLHTDVWAVACASIAVGLLWRRNVRDALLGGLALAAAAYFRASYAAVAYAIAITSIIFLTYVIIRIFVRRLQRKRNPGVNADALSIIAFGLVAFACLLPWHAFLHLENGQDKWSNADAVTWSHVWMTDDYTASVGGDWVSDLGGNWACEIDAPMCSQVLKEEVDKGFPFRATPATVKRWRELAATAVVHHPLRFARNRIGYWLNAVQIGNTGTFSATPDGFGLLRLLFTLTMLVAWLTTTLRSCFRRNPLAFITLIFVGVATGTNVFQHLEARYVWAPVVLAAAGLSVVRIAKTGSEMPSHLD
ncbi:MAG: hypothetical protein WCP28_02510 [Actinomycetes bacterium]